MKNTKKQIVALLLLFGISQVFAQQNVFLDREFWNTNPDVTVVKQKIEEGNDPAIANSNNFDGVVYAILENAPLESIKYLISQKGNDVNKLTHDGRTYIFWAAYKGNVDLMQYLLDNGADTSIVDDHGATILNFAAGSGQQNTKVYDLCLANGADLVNDVNQNGANALLLSAASAKDFALIDYFQSKGMGLNSVDSNGNCIFNYVARNGNTAILDQLIEKGLKGDDRAFIFASYGSRGHTNSIEFYEYLENQGLNPNVANEEGVTPLHVLAYRTKDVELITYFLKKGLDVNKKDENGNTPFMNAASRNSLNIVKLLFKNLKDINAVNAKGQSALMLALQSNNSEVVEFLISKGGDFKMTDKDSNGMLYYLANSYSERNKELFNEKMELLKESGLDIGAKQHNGNTWYHVAVEENSDYLMQLASKLKQDVNAKNNQGNTALHLAAMKATNKDLLESLLRLGAEKQSKTDFDETAYDLAQENEQLQNISLEFLKTK